MGTCRLCGENKKLIEAHIIPRWAYDYCCPEDSKLKKQSLILVGEKYLKRRPIGTYDPNILCERCDGLLGVYDNYGKETLLNGNFEEYESIAYIIKSVDIDKLKIFFLSVLWRASISKISEFNEINLGPHEVKIKKIISHFINNGILITNSYDIIITKFDEGKLPKDLVLKNIQTPLSQKINGLNMCVFYLPTGLKIFFKIDKRKLDNNISKISLNDKRAIIARLGPYEKSNEFKAMLNTID